MYGCKRLHVSIQFLKRLNDCFIKVFNFGLKLKPFENAQVEFLFSTAAEPQLWFLQASATKHSCFKVKFTDALIFVGTFVFALGLSPFS